jgi:hypothetical protein
MIQVEVIKRSSDKSIEGTSTFNETPKPCEPKKNLIIRLPPAKRNTIELKQYSAVNNNCCDSCEHLIRPMPEARGFFLNKVHNTKYKTVQLE